TLVEALRVAAVDAVESRGELFELCLYDRVEVVVHQAERVAAPRPSPGGESQVGDEGRPILVVNEDVAAIDPACGDVVDAGGRQSASRQSSDAPKLARRRPPRIVTSG